MTSRSCRFPCLMAQVRSRSLSHSLSKSPAPAPASAQEANTQPPPPTDSKSKMPVTIDTNARLLVTGASGNLGQLVLKHLLDTLKVSPSNIVAASRNPDKLAEFAARGVALRRMDFNEAVSVEAAAQGVDRALLISGSDIFNRLDGHKTAVTALVAAGVKHILFTSLHNADNSLAFVKTDDVDTEQFVKESKVAGYTILRNGLYFENDFGSITGAKHTGKWFSAAKDGKLAGIARDDLALANATALASNVYENTVYELSGNVGLTVDEIAANVSKALGNPVEVVQVTQEALAQGIAAATGMPLAVADALATFDTSTAAGLAGPLAEDFKKLTGRDPTPHAEWLESVKPVLASL